MQTLFKTIFLFLFFNNLYAQPIKRIYIYNDFLKAGTTGMISQAFHHPEQYNNVVNISTNEILEIDEFNFIISKAKCKKMFSQKIAGIICAGYWIENEKPNYFAICKPSIVFNFTSKRRYILSNDNMNKLLDLVERRK